jgi:hypothetical protein
MPVLSNRKHEQFALAIAKGATMAEAYTSAGYSECGAKQSAARLLRNANIRARVAQIQSEVSARAIALEISNRNARVQALQQRWDRLRLVIEERAASPDYAKVPGGKTGLLVKTLHGTQNTPVFKLDTGLLAELLAHEQQAAQELSQWQSKAVAEERKVIRATPAAVALASVLSLEQLKELEKKMLEEEQKAIRPFIETTAVVQ